MAKKKETKATLVPRKKEVNVFEKIKLEGVDGFNLAEFSLSPLNYQTKELAYTESHFEWYMQVGKVERKFYFKLSYGATAPNAQTDDYLLILLDLLKKKGKGMILETSFYEIHKAKGGRHKPSKREIESIVRHLNALTDIKIETNHIYDREEKAWNSGVVTRVISSYKYKTKNHQRIKKSYDGNGQEIELISEIQELDVIVFDPIFYEHFVRDKINIDMQTYWALETPTARRLYRYGNKYVQSFPKKVADIDLVHFCMTRMRMSPEYIEGLKYTSKIVSKLKRSVARFNDTVPNIQVGMGKDKTQPSGYKISFKNIASSDPTLFGKQQMDSIQAFTSAELKAYKALLKNGIYPNVANKLVISLRQMLGRKTVQYIEYALKKFNRQKWNISDNERGGVLYKAFELGWYRAAFEEWYSSGTKQEEAEDLKRYGHQLLLHNNIEAESQKQELNVENKKVEISTMFKQFSFSMFKKDYPEVYEKIKQKAETQTEKFTSDLKEGKVKNLMLKGIEDRIETYCKLCYDQWNKGHKDFFPDF